MKTTSHGQSTGSNEAPYHVQRISKFLRVVSDKSNPQERAVLSNDDKLIAILGYCKPWQEWVMHPEPNTVWSADCLASIRELLNTLGNTHCIPNNASQKSLAFQ